MPFVQPEISSQQIEETRAAFLKELESRGDSALHPNDIEKIKKDDYYVKRFLMHHDGDQKLALEMIWEALQWRKEFAVNDINENNVKMDILVEGIFFSHGKDKDGCPLFVFKCRKHTKGRNVDEIKRVIVYWMERLEREVKENTVTLMFDMDGCGVSNMDLELVKYLITVFKQYYPYFLNYIIVFEMQWILNAAFKIVKSWLPEKAIERLRVIKKPELLQYVDPDQALKCWGGNNEYVYSFVPETQETVTSNMPNRKVHFADGSPVTDTSLEFNDTGMITVTPSNVIMFTKEANELVSSLELQNTDNKTIISYKMKTTSPEKFRVRPSVGILAPGAQATIHVTVLPGFQLRGLSRDKFLVMSMPVESIDIPQQELAELWKNTTGKSVSQHRLRCVQANDLSKNGEAVPVAGGAAEDNIQSSQIITRLSQLTDCHTELHKAIRKTQLLQWTTIALIIIMGILLAYNLRHETDGFCYRNEEEGNHLD